jgi:hypothetical protein
VSALLALVAIDGEQRSPIFLLGFPERNINEFKLFLANMEAQSENPD